MIVLTQIPDLPTNVAWLDCATNDDASILFATCWNGTTPYVCSLYRRKENVWTAVLSNISIGFTPSLQIVCDNSGKYALFSTGSQIYVSSDYGDNFSLSTLPVVARTVVGICIGGTPESKGYYFYATVSSDAGFYVLKSKNLALSWSIVYTDSDVIWRIAAAKNTGYVYTFTTNETNGFYTSFLISTDYGVKWTSAENQLFGEPRRVLTNNDGRIVTYNFYGEYGLIPFYSNNYLQTYKTVKDAQGKPISTENYTPIFLSNSGKEFYCVNKYDGETGQIYKGKDTTVTKLSDQNMTWSCLCASELSDPNSSQTYLAGTVDNGVWIYTTN